MIVYTKFQITIPCRWFEIAFSTEQSALKTLSKPFLLSVEISNQSSFKISTSKCALVQQCTVFANGTNLVAQSASFVASIFFGVWTIGRKTIGRQRTIGRGGQSVAEGQSVAVDNRSLKVDRSQTIGRQVKILNLHISLMANSEYKKIGN